ncbi:MAG TPA: ATP-binding cassette domain-containing protein [Candidatus Paceibacterota bacterium]
MQSDLVSGTNITRLFPGSSRQGIFDISFSIKKGEVLCVLGLSGAGKSTLLRIIAGLETIDSGILELDRSISEPGKIIYVPQDYTLWPHLTVLENLMLAPREVKKLREDHLNAGAKNLLDRFGLGSYGSSYPHELSGGQKQRVALLRALMMQPAVFLLDEVTSALDPELTKSVLDMIRYLAKDGYTMVVITHHVSLAQTIADRIIFLKDGSIINDESAASFFVNQKDPRILSFIGDAARKDRGQDFQ